MDDGGDSIVTPSGRASVEGHSLLIKRLAKGGLWSSSGAAVSAALGFVVTIVYSRILGTAGAGVVMSCIGIFSIVLSLTRCGMDSTAIWLMPRLKGAAPGLIRAVVRFEVGVVVGVSAVVALAVGLAAPRLIGYRVGEVDAVGALRLMLPFVPCAAALLVLLAVSRGLGGLRPYVVIGSVGLPALRLVGVGLLAGFGVGGAVMGWSVPVAFALAVSIAVVIRMIQESQGDTRPRPLPHALGLIILRFAGPRTVAAGLEQALLWLDVVLVGMLAGPAAAGIYGGASRFVTAGMIIDTAIRVVVSPRFSALLQRRRIEQLQELYSIAAGWLTLFSAPLFVVLAVFAPTFLGWLGEEFRGGTNALVILCIGSVVTLAAGNIHSILLMSGRSVWAAANKAVVLTANVAGNLLLVPRFGVEGAAISWAVAMFADALLASIEVRYFIGVSVHLRHVGYAGLAGMVCMGIPSLVGRALVGPGSTPAMLLCSMVGGVTLLVWCYLDRERLGLHARP